MNVLTVVEGARAWARTKGGVFKQLDVYQRGDRFFIKHGGGFVRLEAKYGDRWLTSHPDVSVWEVSGCDPS